MKEVSIREVTMLSKAILICALATYFTEAAVIKGNKLLSFISNKFSSLQVHFLVEFSTSSVQSVRGSGRQT